MKSFTAVAAFVGAAAAMMTGTGHVAYTTEVMTAYTTYCPEATTFAVGSSTYTVTEATTVTITDCPDHACTVVKPVHTSTAVHCGGNGSCGDGHNTTVPWHPAGTGSTGVATAGHPSTTAGNTPPIVASGAGNVVALSGAALAGVLAVAVAL